MNDRIRSSWKISISGAFFDSYVYAGKLFLVAMDKKLYCLHWGRLIESLCRQNPDQQIGLHFAFADSSALYRIEGKFLSTLTRDQDIEEVFAEKIISGKAYELGSIEEIEANYGCVYSKTIELETLPADMLIYGKRIFMCSEAGLLEIPFKRVFPSKTNLRYWEGVNKVSNQPFVSMCSASYGYILLAGLSDGVWQYALNDYGNESRMQLLDRFHASYIHRDYNDYLSGSYVNRSYLVKREVSFGDPPDEDDTPRPRKTTIRREISLEEWFQKDDAYFFSRNYIIYCIANGHIYSSTKRVIESQSRDREDAIKTYEVSLPEGQVREARVEVFGIVIEYADRIVVLLADGIKEEITFGGRKLTTWKTFPESRNYLNQLHLIFENEIEIYSFNGPATTINRIFGFNYQFAEFSD